MDTSSAQTAGPAATATAQAAEVPGRRTAEPADPLAPYQAADFPWYGLDEGWTGRRWLLQAGAGGIRPGQPRTIDYGSLGHGEEPPRQQETHGNRRFAVVVTVAHRPGRRSADGTGLLEATSASSAAWLAAPACSARPGPGSWTGPAARSGWTSRPPWPGTWPTTSAAPAGPR